MFNALTIYAMHDNGQTYTITFIFTDTGILDYIYLHIPPLLIHYVTANQLLIIKLPLLNEQLTITITDPIQLLNLIDHLLFHSTILEIQENVL